MAELSMNNSYDGPTRKESTIVIGLALLAKELQALDDVWGQLNERLSIAKAALPLPPNTPNQTTKAEYQPSELTSRIAALTQCVGDIREKIHMALEALEL